MIYYWTKDQWELFDLVNDPYEVHNLYGEPGMAPLTSTLKAELARLKREVRDVDQFANERAGSFSQPSAQPSERVRDRLNARHTHHVAIAVRQHRNDSGLDRACCHAALLIPEKILGKGRCACQGPVQVWSNFWPRPWP